MFDDLTHIKNKIVFQYERFALADPQCKPSLHSPLHVFMFLKLDFFDEILKHYSLEPGVQIEVVTPSLAPVSKRARREYRGDKSHPNLNLATVCVDTVCVEEEGRDEGVTVPCGE